MAVSDALGVKEAAEAAVGVAEAAVEVVTGQLDQAVLDAARGQVIMDELNDALSPLADDVVVKTYLKGVQDDLADAEELVKAVAVAELADLLAL